MSTKEEVIEWPNEFIKNVICEVIKNENIEEFTTRVTAASGIGENFMGLLCRVSVTGNKDNGEPAMLSLVLKVPLQSDKVREMFPIESLYIKEVFVYNVMLPELCALEEKFNVPQSERFQRIKCLKASSERLKEFLLLQDMREEGFRMANRRESLGVKHLKLVLKSMASFHALSFVLKKLNPKTFSELANSDGGLKDYSPYKDYLILARERAIAAVEDKEIAEKASIFTSDIMKKLDMYTYPEAAEPYTVLCHGDFWNNNILFKFEEDEPVEVRILDWQESRYCSPITDIAYLIFAGTDYDTRKEHLHYLLDYYHQCLTKKLSFMDCDIEDIFPKIVFDEHVKKFLSYGIYMAIMLLPTVCGEAEDVPDIDTLLDMEKVTVDDLHFVNKQTTSRFATRITGVFQTFIDLGVI